MLSAKNCLKVANASNFFSHSPEILLTKHDTAFLIGIKGEGTPARVWDARLWELVKVAEGLSGSSVKHTTWHLFCCNVVDLTGN